MVSVDLKECIFKADVITDYDVEAGELRALYVTPFLDENLLKEDYTGPGPMLAWYTQDGLGSVRQLVVGERVLNSYDYRRKGKEVFRFFD